MFFDQIAEASLRTSERLASPHCSSTSGFFSSSFDSDILIFEFLLLRCRWVFLVLVLLWAKVVLGDLDVAVGIGWGWNGGGVSVAVGVGVRVCESINPCRDFFQRTGFVWQIWTTT